MTTPAILAVVFTFVVVLVASYASGMGWIEAGEDTPGFTLRDRGVRVRMPAHGGSGSVFANLYRDDGSFGPHGK